MFDAPLSITQSQSREYEKNPILFPHLPHFLSLHSAFPSPSLPIIFSSYFPSLSIPLPFFILPFPFPSSLFVSPSLLPNPSLLPVRFHCSPLDFLPQQLDSIPPPRGGGRELYTPLPSWRVWSLLTSALLFDMRPEDVKKSSLLTFNSIKDVKKKIIKVSVHSKVFLDLCSRSRAAVCFSGMLSATHYFSDLPEIETALPEMVTVLPEIEIALLQIDSPLTQSLFAVGLEFFLGRSRFAAWRLFDFWQVGKIIKVALSAVPKPTATWDLKWRSMLCLRRTFPKKKN